MRIAFFTDTFYPQINGVSNTLFYLSRYLQAKNIEHMFFAPDYGFVSDECSNLPVTRFKGFSPIIYPECRIAFVSPEKMILLLSDFSPDVVHIVSELGIGLSGLRAATSLGIPIVMSYHTSFDKYLHFYHLTHISHALWLYMKWFHSFALINLCPSHNTLEAMKQRGIKNLDIWSRGIDLNRFHPSHFSSELRMRFGAQNKTVFLYVGRVSAEKGLDVLMQSIYSVNKIHGDEVQFWITGNGPILKKLASLKIPNVIFTGEKRGTELSEIYASADAFVFPSGTETFGNVLLEAMASGLPVICTDTGGVTDFTVHNINALVCRNGDSDSLSQSITSLLDPDLRSRIRRQALCTAKSRSWDAVFDNLMQHYLSSKISLRECQIGNINTH